MNKLRILLLVLVIFVANGCGVEVESQGATETEQELAVLSVKQYMSNVALLGIVKQQQDWIGSNEAIDGLIEEAERNIGEFENYMGF